MVARVEAPQVRDGLGGGGGGGGGGRRGGGLLGETPRGHDAHPGLLLGPGLEGGGGGGGGGGGREDVPETARGVRGVDVGRGVLRARVAAPSVQGGHAGQRDGLVVQLPHQVRLAVRPHLLALLAPVAVAVAVAVAVGVGVGRGVVVGVVELLLGLVDGGDSGGVVHVGAVLAGAHHGDGPAVRAVPGSSARPGKGSPTRRLSVQVSPFQQIFEQATKWKKRATSSQESFRRWARGLAYQALMTLLVFPSGHTRTPRSPGCINSRFRDPPFTVIS